MTIDDLGLGVRASNCLKDLGITEFSQLLKATDKDLLAHKNCGKKTLMEIRECQEEFLLDVINRIEKKEFSYKREMSWRLVRLVKFVESIAVPLSKIDFFGGMLGSEQGAQYIKSILDICSEIKEGKVI